MQGNTRSLGGWALSILLVVATLPMPSAAAPLPTALSSTLDAPQWAIGFSWTYNYDGPYRQSIGSGSYSYSASHMNDTYVSSVVGEVNIAAGPAWIVRNDHAGTMQGNVTAPIIGTNPSTATFTSVTNATVLKANYAIVNFTQDLAMTATVPIVGSVNGAGHNETVATPPFEQIAFTTPADGTLWHIVTNLTSTGWYQIGSGGQTSTSGYVALDYNLSVGGTQSVTVPAGTFEVYNISGGGTADYGGTVYSFTEQFYWSPLVQNKVIDEGGYRLVDYDVNRQPVLVTPLPAMNITAGEGADIDLTAYFDDPDGDPLTFSCQPLEDLNCTVGPGDVLNMTASPGINATFNLSVTVDDGRPGGRVSFRIVVLVTGAGNSNQPPVALSHGTLTTAEDVAFRFTVADYFSDPDDGIALHQATVTPPTTVTNEVTGAFDVVPPQDFTGALSFTVAVFDFGGLSTSSVFALDVTPVNDPPQVFPVGPPTKAAHVGQNVTVSAIVQDPDDSVLTFEWTLDGSAVGSSSTVTFPAALAGPGTHTLGVAVTDAAGDRATLSYTLLVSSGPQIVAMTPSELAFSVGTGSVIDFAVTAEDPDSPSLNYTWEFDGAEIEFGTDLDESTASFDHAGSFVMKVTVSDNGSEDSAEWLVNVIEVPDGLISIANPVEGSLLRVNATTTVTVRAAVDANLSGVVLEWRINGVPYSTATEFEYVPPSSGNYVIRLQASGRYTNGVHYSAVDQVNVSVLIVVGPGTPGNNGTNNTNPPPPVTSPPLDGLVWLLLIVVAVAAVAAAYVWMRRSRKGDEQPP